MESQFLHPGLSRRRLSPVRAGASRVGPGSFFGEAVKQARAGMDIPVATSFEGIVERAFVIGRIGKILPAV